jgi:hypothetical protein
MAVNLCGNVKNVLIGVLKMNEKPQAAYCLMISATSGTVARFEGVSGQCVCSI